MKSGPWRASSGCSFLLSHILAGAAFAHHFEEKVLHDHEEKEDLALLSPRHPAEHHQKLRIDLLGKRCPALGVCHL